MAVMYRTYRPQRFDDLIGQDHIRLVLENALKNNQVGHAYLFAGPRGTGKTSTARLLAKSLSCLDKKDANPCNKCAICKEIEGGGYVDIFEIDAASNRGVDEIRTLRDAVTTGPARGKYKIYIIDEVHMLTKEAFNALLKTLEEPPSHVVFVLATTELHKVPETIISRCQRLIFNRADSDSLIQLLKDVAKKEKLKVDDGALRMVAQRSEGSYRDALSLLNSLSNTDADLTEDVVRSVLLLPSSELVKDVVKLIYEGNRKDLVKNLQSFIETGGNTIILAKEISQLAKNELFKEQSEYSHAFLLMILEQSLAIQGIARSATDPETLSLAKLISMCAADMNENIKEPIKVEKVVVKELPKEEIKEPIKTVKVEKTEEKQEIKSDTPVDAITPASSEANQDGAFWPLFMSYIKEKNHALYAVIRLAKLQEYSEQKVIIAVKFRFYAERLYEPSNRKIIDSCLKDITGKDTAFECMVQPDMEITDERPKKEDVMASVVDVFEIEEAQ